MIKMILWLFTSPHQMAVGETLRHPDGRMVFITWGAYYGEFGLHNWWHWQEVKGDGTLGPEEQGYGWT